METTLAAYLQPHVVPMDTLHQRYGSLLELVRNLIGVVPNCDPFLEIWPIGFRAYNVMVPNLLNLPFSIWGASPPAKVVGLGMYVASRTAGCAYCSAHTCSFALRRGASADKVAHALSADDGSHTPAERAVVAVGRSLAAIPAALSQAEREEIARHYSPAEVEWIVLGITMIGFLNKFMDAIGVPLEGSTAAEVDELIAPSGWTQGQHLDPSASAERGSLPHPDTLGTKLGLIKYIPSALSLDRKWTAGVPKRWPAAGVFLRTQVGHDFPVLGRLRHARAIRAIAVMIRDNLDAQTSVIGVGTKCLAGLIYATAIGDLTLADEVRALAAHAGVSSERLDQVAPLGALDDGEFAAKLPALGCDQMTHMALLLAHAISPSPARVTASLVQACREQGLTPPAVIELVVFISLMQMLHRLSAFYAA